MRRDDEVNYKCDFGKFGKNCEYNCGHFSSNKSFTKSLVRITHSNNYTCLGTLIFFFKIFYSNFNTNLVHYFLFY